MTVRHDSRQAAAYALRLIDDSELRDWYGALAARDTEPATIYFWGDSVTNGGFATAKSKTYARVFMDSIQRMYRVGGIGYQPAGNPGGGVYLTPWVTAGSPVAQTTYGPGHHALLMNNNATQYAEITVTTDRVHLYFATDTTFDVAEILIDGVQVATIDTTGTANGITRWDSGAIAEGVLGKTHTIRVRPASGSTIVLTGIMVFDTDYGKGVQVWEGGRSGSTTADWTTYPSNHYSFMDPAYMDPDLVIIQFGLNDQLQGLGGPTFKANLSTMIDNVYAASAKPVSIMLMSLWASAVANTRTDATVTNGSAVVTSAGASYTDGIIGSIYDGTDFPAGTKVLSRQSATQVTMTANATAGGSNRTFRVRPTEEMWAPYRAAMKELADERNLYLFDMYDLVEWLGDTGEDSVNDLATTNTSAVVNSNTALFRATVDEGMGISGAGIPGGTTILSVQSATQATMSANATATATGVAATFTNRRDPNRLTTDLLHPSDRGMQWIADELSRRLAGLPKFANIPVGVFDVKGDTIVATGPDAFARLPAGQEGQVPAYAASSPNGMTTADPGMLNRIIQVLANPGAATFANVGLAAAPTVTSPTAAASDDQTTGPFVRVNTAGTSNSDASVVTPFTICRSAWIPEFTAIVMPHTSLAVLRIWVGLFSATPVAGSDPASLHAAAFRYDTGADGTAFWRTYTKDGTTATVKTTTQSIATSTRYTMRIEFRGTAGTNATQIRFYINEALVGIHDTNLPGGSTNNLGVHVGVRTLEAVAKSLRLGRFCLSYV